MNKAQKSAFNSYMQLRLNALYLFYLKIEQVYFERSICKISLFLTCEP